MSIHDKTITRIIQMPDYLVKEVNKYIDYLLWKHAKEETFSALNLSESQELVEADFSDYLSNLEDYENRLANGQMKW